MSQTEYFKLMRETSLEVDKYIEGTLLRFQGQGELEDILKELPNKRKGRLKMRPFLTRLSYQISGGKNWHSIIPVLASMELNNIHLYLHNWIFDNKNNVWGEKLGQTRSRVNDLIISSQVFRELSGQALEEGISSLRKSHQKQIREDFNKSIIQCSLGFKEDLDLTIDRFPEFATDKDFILEYEEKSENQSGNIYGVTAVFGALLAKVNLEQTIKLEAFGSFLGTGLHVSNDLGDFALPSQKIGDNFKPYQDQLSDIREGRLTLPIYYVLKNGTEKQRDSMINLIGNSNASYMELKSASQSVLDSGAYDFCKEFSKRYYSEGKAALHKNFSSSENRDLLSIMISSIRSNKFLSELRKLKS